MGVWFREPMIVGKSGTVFWGIDDDHISLIRFSRQSRQWWQLIFQFWHRNHWHHPPDWMALTIISTGTLVRIGWLCHQIDWHWSPERSQLPELICRDCRHWRHFRDKKDGLVGEFKFFSDFEWSETGATDWKQTKAESRSYQPNLFQTDSSVFFCQQSAQ